LVYKVLSGHFYQVYNLIIYLGGLVFLLRMVLWRCPAARGYGVAQRHLSGFIRLFRAAWLHNRQFLIKNNLNS